LILFLYVLIEKSSVTTYGSNPIQQREYLEQELVELNATCNLSKRCMRCSSSDKVTFFFFSFISFLSSLKFHFFLFDSFNESILFFI